MTTWFRRGAVAPSSALTLAFVVFTACASAPEAVHRSVGADVEGTNASPGPASEGLRIPRSREHLVSAVERVKLTVTAGGPDFRLGTQVAIDGATAVVSGSGNATYDDKTYVFTGAGNAWSLVQALTPTTPSFESPFVAISGTTIVMSAGAPSGVAEGTVAIFDLSGPTWSQTQTLSEPAGSAVSSFGYHFAIDGDDLAVMGDCPAGGALACVYFFHRTAGVWASTQSLMPTADDTIDDSLARLALHGTTAVAVNGGISGGDVHVAHVFTNVGGSWAESAQLAPPSGSTGDGYGTDVAIADDDTILVGAQQGSIDSVGQGVVYAYSPTGSTWSLTQTLGAGTFTDAFGSTLAGRGSDLVVGDCGAGASCVFTETGGVWTQVRRLVPSDGDGYATGMGASVATDGNEILVGATGSWLAGPIIAGAAYLFDLSGNPGAACSSPTDCPFGFCTDGVCCAVAACNPCGTCAGTAPGVCVDRDAGDSPSPSWSCSGFVCGGGYDGCPTSCASDAACAVGFVCTGGVCVPPPPPVDAGTSDGGLAADGADGSDAALQGGSAQGASSCAVVGRSARSSTSGSWGLALMASVALVRRRRGARSLRTG